VIVGGFILLAIGLTFIVGVSPLTARIPHSLTLRGNVDAVLSYCKLSLVGVCFNFLCWWFRPDGDLTFSKCRKKVGKKRHP
jgi:hypothetical protein